MGSPTSTTPPISNPGTPDVMDANFDSGTLRSFDAGETVADDAYWAGLFGQSSTDRSVFRQNNLSLIAESGRGNVMRQRYIPNGTGSDPVGAYLTLNSSANEMFLQYEFYFEPGFDFTTKGGKFGGGLGSHRQAPTGGSTSQDGYDARITFVEPSAGPSSTGTGMAIYMYHYDRFVDNGSHYGEDVRFDNGNIVVGAGQWYTVRLRLQANSTSGASDGVVEAWLDGTKMLSRTNMRWWGPNTGSVNRDIGAFFYSSFYGGSTAAFNPSNTGYTRFDNYEISTDDSLLTGGVWT